MPTSSSDLLSQLDTIISEGRNPDTLHIDEGSALDIVTLLNAEDHKVAPAIAAILPQVAAAVDVIVARLERGGRLIYTGAGTSGRLGILDAAECRPTFSVPDGLVVGLIAGGRTAIEHAVEGAEDNEQQGAADLDAIALQPDDVVVGLTASGRTPYVCGALSHARQHGAATIAIACTPDSPVFTDAQLALCPVVGPEALTGSTRLKAGTAQKLLLNMLSTATMIRMGKTYQNLMVDVQASNQKLKARALRIVMQATGCGREQAEQALHAAGQQTKAAILMLLTHSSAEEAQAILDASAGRLSPALARHQPE